MSFVNQRKETFLSKASDLSESKMEFENKFTAAKEQDECQKTNCVTCNEYGIKMPDYSEVLNNNFM